METEVSFLFLIQRLCLYQLNPNIFQSPCMQTKMLLKSLACADMWLTN